MGKRICKTGRDKWWMKKGEGKGRKREEEEDKEERNETCIVKKKEEEEGRQSKRGRNVKKT